MRDVYELLREKENALERVDREIEALRLVAPLLTDDTDTGPVLATAPAVRDVADAQRLRPKGPLRAARPPVTNEPGRWSKGAMDYVKSETAKHISSRLKRLVTPLLNASRFAS